MSPHFSDFDCKVVAMMHMFMAIILILILMVQVIDYQSRLDRDFTTRSYISQTRSEDLRLWECALHTLKV